MDISGINVFKNILPNATAPELTLRSPVFCELKKSTYQPLLFTEAEPVPYINAAPLTLKPV